VPLDAAATRHHSEDMAHDWTAVFNAAHADPVSSTFSDLMSAGMGEEHPQELGPYSWISRTELTMIADVVRDTGTRLVDVGCGRGGPGLWVAAETGAHLTGIDIASTGLEAATESARSLGVVADFRLGSFDDIPLDDASVDVAMSVDAFLFAPDKPAGARELARVLRPGGRLVMTSWDYHSQPVNRPPQVDDHRPLLADAGLAVERYDETADWEHRQRSFSDGLLANAHELARHHGEDPDAFRRAVVEMRATLDCMTRRFFLVARRA
jgi:SAM-dependent methyltransferase